LGQPLGHRATTRTARKPDVSAQENVGGPQAERKP